MKLSHTLGNLLGGLGNTQLLEGEWLCVEELLEATILECAQHAWADSLSSETLQDLELRLTVDEMLYLWAVDTEK